MNLSRLRWFFLLMMLFQKNVYAQFLQNDSIVTDTISTARKLNISGFLASSFFINTNWKEINNSCITLSGSVNIEFIKSGEGKKRIQEFRSDISYLKFIDSVWIKNTDNIFLSSIWRMNGKKNIRSSFSISMKSQLTNTWEFENLGSYLSKKWKSGPLLPLIFISGYGINILLPNESYLNVSLASVKINSQPRFGYIQKETKIIARTDKIILESQFGANIQSLLKLYLSKNTTWDNNTSIFITGISKKVISFDLKNTFTLKLLRYCSIKFENKIGYDIKVSNNLQMRNELLMGFNYLR